MANDLLSPSPKQFSACDGFAIRNGDAIVLIGRVLLGLLFLMNVWPRLVAGPVPGFARYLASLGFPAPEFFAWLSTAVEVVGCLALIFGVATRYGALLLLLYVIIATAAAHRYWEYPAAAQVAQYNNFIKGIAIMGGLVLLYVTGAGRYSIDAMMRKR